MKEIQGCQEATLSRVICIRLRLPIGTTKQDTLRVMERKGREASESQNRLMLPLSAPWTQFPHQYPKRATVMPSSTSVPPSQ